MPTSSIGGLCTSIINCVVPNSIPKMGNTDPNLIYRCKNYNQDKQTIEKTQKSEGENKLMQPYTFLMPVDGASNVHNTGDPRHELGPREKTNPSGPQNKQHEADYKT